MAKRLSSTQTWIHTCAAGRIEDYEERIRQLESEIQEDDDEQSNAIEKLRRELTLARNEAAEAQREKLTLFDEQKRLESQVQRLSSEISRANQAMDKMRTEQVAMRSKNTDLRDAYASLKRKVETDAAASATALEERDTSIAHLRSLLDRRKKESSNTAVREAHAALGLNQDQQLQQQRMPPPTTFPTGTGGVISNTPFIPSFSTPSTWIKQERSMGQIITMLVHRQTQVMQSRCVPCMVERRRSHLDKTHHDMTHCPMGHPLEGQVVMLLLAPDGTADPVKGFRLSRTAELSQAAGSIRIRLRTSGHSNLLRAEPQS